MVTVDDDTYATHDTSLIDFAIGMGSKYVNITGLFGLDKIMKVSRYSEIYKATHPYTEPEPAEEAPEGEQAAE